MGRDGWVPYVPARDVAHEEDGPDIQRTTMRYPAPTELEEVRERLLKPKGKTSEATREEISRLSAAYLEERNRKLRAQAFWPKPR